MNFTREPIIETIITPKDGYKLVVRNSKGGNQEEFSVDAVEVVSFGHSFFFRSLEKPRSFLVPVSDYEVLEVKETRVVLKNAGPERAIKIGGGREAPMRQQPREPAIVEEEEQVPAEPLVAEPIQESRLDKKRDRHRRRRRRSSDERHRPADEHHPLTASASEADQGGGANDETQVSSSMFSTLFPPPTTLISQTLNRYKDKDAESSERDVFPKPVEEPKKEDSAENPGTGEVKHLHRVTTEASFTYSDENHFII